uniref:Probable magnesium transporter n=1 Tax=Chenopodium quinoa TaxID=63459 RepID=A0A803L045_CHEQI
MQESGEASGTYNGMSSDNIKGLVLALSSSFFIGASFIVKKKGLKKAGSSGVRAGLAFKISDVNAFAAVVVGEIANFAAYAFAPAILVTPLGAVSIIISATLAHIILRERLHIFGILGCILCVVGSITIVLHAPQERQIESVAEVWDLATEPGFLAYAVLVLLVVFFLMVNYVPQYGQTHVMVYIGICSLVGSLSVMGVKALGIALKLTFSGMNQLALDTFNTAVVSPIYYVMFTTFTIVASVIMFKDWAGQNGSQIVTEMCGFVTILAGTFLLHKTKDMTDSPSFSFSRTPKHSNMEEFDLEGAPLVNLELTRTS